ncbi:uncharacterized protein LOC105930431 isoform X1 [Fundulus heteroclitus]|uniref:uncharacterized protein LOC105930431 isoform X1 n=1 Tax=Fundulus heteroclitus TaxID=8078 RepID=UPI00165C4BE4|nr:uncharacterized protein LOC105930431 isoform X1 [Fundulus heteroclitus]
MVGSVTAGVKKGTFVWTDEEVELLLRATLDYKSRKAQDSVDWESCKSKYSDILMAFLEQYPVEAGNKDFPHDVSALTKAQIMTKIKNIRSKYRLAVETGRRSSQGRVLILFYELCEEIWGGSPAPCSIAGGIESSDLVSPPSSASSPTRLECPDSPQPSAESPPAAAVTQRRSSLQAQPHGHRRNTLKKKRQCDYAAHEELKLRKRMLELMEDSARRSADTIRLIGTSIASINEAMSENNSLLRALVHQSLPRYQSASMSSSPHPATPAYQSQGVPQKTG